MQYQEQNERTPGPVKHPDTTEWVGFLYRELAPARTRELRAHLARCAPCAEQVKNWRAGMGALDAWTLPVPRPAPRQWLPVLKWATAAALVLGLGFGLGRRTAPASGGDLAALQASVAELADTLQRERNQNAALAANAAGVETTRLLAKYSRAQDEQRAADRQDFRLALQALDTRFARLQTELETVAVNTADGFQQTRQNLTRLASYSLPTSRVPFNPEPR